MIIGRCMMSDQQSPAPDRQAGGSRLSRMIDERRASSVASREEIARVAATLGAAQSVLASGRAPERAPVAAASVPLLARRPRSGALADDRRRRRLAAGLRRTPALRDWLPGRHDVQRRAVQYRPGNAGSASGRT